MGHMLGLLLGQSQPVLYYPFCSITFKFAVFQPSNNEFELKATVGLKDDPLFGRDP